MAAEKLGLQANPNPLVSANLVEMFLGRVDKSSSKPALSFKQEGRYHSITWRDFADQVRWTALALYHWGVRKGDRVGILSENRPEWAIADLGILSLGAASVPIYPTSSRKECYYIIEHAEIKIIFVSTKEQFEKIEPLLQEGKINRVVRFDFERKVAPHVFNFNDFKELGRRVNQSNTDLYRQKIDQVTREDLATVIYTSGTTGPPKGVMLTHGNFLSNCEGSAKVLCLEEDAQSLSFLPLSHVFERMAGYYYMIQEGAPIAYAESMQTVPEDLGLVRPTVAASVPRFFEKMYAKIMETLQSSSPLKQALFYWALKVGKEAGVYREKHRRTPLLIALRYALARSLVFSKLKRKLGGRIKFFISGGAPLAKELAEFFYSADVLILEGYGLTETSPVISVNRPDRFKFGTVGLPLDQVEVRIGEDGEVLTRGPHVMKGYFKNEGATREVIRDGWFYTGDLGEIDGEGFLKITGRKKDLIITAGGKNISPQNIENEVLSDPLFSQLVVLGDRKPYLVALVVPNRAELERLAEAHGIHSPSWEKLLQEDRIYQVFGKRIEEKTQDFAAFEKIKYFHLLPKEFSQEEGELTPTLKVKRRVIMERYASIIESLYEKGKARVEAGNFSDHL